MRKLRKPIIEIIAQNILDAINQITTANGFHQDLSAYRPRRNDFADVVPQNGTVLVVQSDEEDVEGAYGTDEWRQSFVLMAMVIDSDKATPQETIDTKINTIRADVQKKLAEDVTRGGYAIDTINRGSALFADGPKFTGVAIVVEIHYRTKNNDPYSKA